MDWIYTQPVNIHFGIGRRKELASLLGQWERGVLVCDAFFTKNGLAQEVTACAGGKLTAIFSDLTPNPSVDAVDACAALMREQNAQFAVALGGGSSIDCAKAACAVAPTKDSVRAYHSGGKALTQDALPLIALPTTAGTGTEVTCVAVLTDGDHKAPVVHASLYPKIALIDPELTASVPPKVTASTGLDVLSHALEGFWSRAHQPVCDALALHAAQLVFEWLPRAFANGADLAAREKMAEASVIAGLAFTLPKTAASHACSFPLTTLYGIPHGEACAFTLDALCTINAPAEGGRLHRFARRLGFADAEEMGRQISRFKREMGMRRTLAEANIASGDVPELARRCQHPNLLNNPVALDQAALERMFLSMQ